MGNKLGNEHNTISVQAKVIVNIGYAITAGGYVWTGSSPANGDPIGFSCAEEPIAIGGGIPVNTERTRVVIKAGGAFAQGVPLHLDNTGRPIYKATPVDGDWYVGVSDSVSTAAGDECYMFQNIVKVVIDT